MAAQKLNDSTGRYFIDLASSQRIFKFCKLKLGYFLI